MQTGMKVLGGKLTEENIRRAQTYRFFMVGPYYVLAYGKPKKNGLKPLPEPILQLMTPSEQEWLKDCIEKTCAESATIIAKRNDAAFMEAFDRELMAELTKQEKEG